MKVDHDVQAIIDKVQNGDFKEYLQKLDNTEFGLYLPAYEENGSVKLLLEGYSQNEKDLLVSVSRSSLDHPIEALQVGWVGSVNGKDVRCKHPDGRTCSHCTTHTGPTINCSKHANTGLDGILDAPELDYDKTVSAFSDLSDLLPHLGSENLGLYLLHGHSKQFAFTKLPEGYVSVIENGVTSFRKEAEVAGDPNFIPNVWRSINGKVRVAGGYYVNA